MEMENYSSIADHFPAKPDNEGLEGITVNTQTDHIVVVNEARPGLLIEIDLPRGRILHAILLEETNGFNHADLSIDKLNFFGLSYDSSRETFWITSDIGQCLFHYDWTNNCVIQRLDMNRKAEKSSAKVRKSARVAIDPAWQLLYVVSERDGNFFNYRINSHG